MDTAGYVEKISALFSRIMLEPLAVKLPAEAMDIELTDSQFQGMVYLLRHENTSIGDLAEGLSISHPAAVKMVDRLQKKGLVIREESATDRRVSHVRLTPLGAGIVEKAQAERLGTLTRATQQMAPDELEDLIRGLEALLSAALASKKAVDRACLRCGKNHIGCCPVNRAHSVLTGTAVTKT